jgi:hypothetical protein
VRNECSSASDVYTTSSPSRSLTLRFTTTILFASFLIGTAACASSGTGGGGSPETDKPQSGNGTGTTDPKQPPAEKPLTAKSVCETVETNANLGDGCSGTGSGQEVCALEDTSCGVNKCVYDTRNAGTYAFYCAPKCSTADPSVACPLGYECVAPTSTCAGEAEDGVCAKRADFGCKDVGDAGGLFVEGLDGELLVVKFSGTQGSLRQKTNTGWRTLTTWSDPSTSGVLRGVARSDERLLIVTNTNDILVENGAATATKRDTTTTSYAPVVGVAANGDFVLLETTSNSYATLSRRGTDGKWSEVGPTRKRVASLSALGKGFLARCGEELCASADGEAFDPISAPPDVTITQVTTFAAAGRSYEDFFFAIEGRVFHYRKGKWVEEGPRGQAAGSSSSYSDKLRVSSTGAVAFSTWNGTSYVTYSATDGGECWKQTSENVLSSFTLVGNAMMWTPYGGGQLCTLGIE